MSVTTTTKPQYRYDSTGMLRPYAGYWDVKASATGDSGGGTITINVVPNSPTRRILVIDWINAEWQTTSGSTTGGKVGVELPATRPLTTLTLASPDMSGAVKGLIPIEFPNGFIWQSFNTGDRFLFFTETNKDTLFLAVTAGGRFYEGRAGKLRRYPGGGVGPQIPEEWLIDFNRPQIGG